MRKILLVALLVIGGAEAPPLLVGGLVSPPLRAATSPAGSPPLVDAVKSGKRDAALALVAQRVDVNAPEPTARPHCTGRCSRTISISCTRLIRAGAKVNVKNDFGSTPMAEAAIVGRAALLERAARSGRRRRVAERRRSDGADGRGAHQPGGCGTTADSARRERERGGAVARADGTDVGGRADSSRRWCASS